MKVRKNLFSKMRSSAFQLQREELSCLAEILHVDYHECYRKTTRIQDDYSRRHILHCHNKNMSPKEIVRLIGIISAWCWFERATKNNSQVIKWKV